MFVFLFYSFLEILTCFYEFLESSHIFLKILPIFQEILRFLFYSILIYFLFRLYFIIQLIIPESLDNSSLEFNYCFRLRLFYSLLFLACFGWNLSVSRDFVSDRFFLGVGMDVLGAFLKNSLYKKLLIYAPFIDLFYLCPSVFINKIVYIIFIIFTIVLKYCHLVKILYYFKISYISLHNFKI